MYYLFRSFGTLTVGNVSTKYGVETTYYYTNYVDQILLRSVDACGEPY